MNAIASASRPARRWSAVPSPRRPPGWRRLPSTLGRAGGPDELRLLGRGAAVAARACRRRAGRFQLDRAGDDAAHGQRARRSGPRRPAPPGRWPARPSRSRREHLPRRTRAARAPSTACRAFCQNWSRSALSSATAAVRIVGGPGQSYPGPAAPPRVARSGIRRVSVPTPWLYKQRVPVPLRRERRRSRSPVGQGTGVVRARRRRRDHRGYPSYDGDRRHSCEQRRTYG